MGIIAVTTMHARHQADLSLRPTCVAVLIVEGADVGVGVASDHWRVVALLDDEVHAVRQRKLADGALQAALQVPMVVACGPKASDMFMMHLRWTGTRCGQVMWPMPTTSPHRQSARNKPD